MPHKKIKYIGTAYFALVVTAGVLFYFFGQTSAAQVIESLKSLGFPGAAAFIALFVFGTLVFFPVTLLAFSSGVLYGLGWGFAAALLSATFGACIAFLLSRYIFRDWVQKKMAEGRKFRAFEEDVSKRGWQIVALSRVSFILPYTALNYAFGLTPIPFPRYALTTLIAMIPSTLLYVYLGSMAGTVAAYFQNRKNPSLLEFLFFGVALAGSAGLVVYLGGMIKKIKNR